VDLTIRSFFHYYMFEPVQAEKPAERLLAMVSTIALGILSFGLVHLICYYTMFERSYLVVKEPTGQEAKAEQVFQREMSREEDSRSISSSWDDSLEDSAEDPFAPNVPDNSEKDEVDVPKQVHFLIEEEIVPSFHKESRLREEVLYPSPHSSINKTESKIIKSETSGGASKKSKRLHRYFSRKCLTEENEKESKKKKPVRTFSVKNLFHRSKQEK
jgi:hypothetical protein